MSEEARKKTGENFMTKIASFIVAKRNLFFLFVILGFLFSAVSIGWVEVENDLVFYLPSNSETKIGMEIMEDNFVTLGTANVMVANITYEDALAYVDDISEVEGVQSVTFDRTSAHYQNASALYTISFAYDQYDSGCEKSLTEVKQVLAGQDVYVGSEIGYSLPDIIAREVEVIMVYVAVIIILVLLLNSQTYAEIPVLLLTFIVAAVLNMGTNFMMGKISFVSNSVTTVLQLALSLDYAVIFCNRYKEEHKSLPIKEAVVAALSKSIPEITASSLTTIGGLFAMLFMQFKIGPDMGINLIKSILFALLSVFVVMPGLLVLFGPLMDKTTHKNFIPEIPFVGKFAYATHFIVPPIFVAVIFAACHFAGDCPYVYGYNKLETAKLNEKKIAEHMIADNFTSSEMVALVLPAGDYEAEGEILAHLSEYEEVESAMGLANVEALGGYVLSDSLSPREFAELTDLDYELAQVIYAAYAAEQGSYEKIISNISTYKVPLIDMFLFVCEQVDSGLVSLGEEQQAMLSVAQTQMQSAKQQLQSEDYSRMLVYLDIPEGGDTLYGFLDTMRGIAEEYYPEGEVYVVGNPTSEYDFQKTFSRDNTVISVLTILIVLLVLLFTFKSVGMPLLLILVIQGSIWMNFSVPTFTGNGIFFMTYLIVSAIQMGANIDYAIVIASRFMELKDKMPHKQAIVETMNFAFPTIAISGTIMATASFFIGNMTSEGSIANMGLNLARGTLISICLVMFVLPQLLLVGAKIIDKTSFSMPGDFHKQGTGGRNVVSSIVVLVLTVVLGGSVVPVQAADITYVSEETIKIKDVEDLLELAENCKLDSWSRGKTVVLQADIFLEEEFLPIPTFGGIFDGKGHSINGLQIDSGVSPAGLFGVVQECAVIKNINVTGNVEPAGINNAVGGIAGENYGKIINSTFTGTVKGKTHTGGIVGINSTLATLQNCRISGMVLGETMTGGICGYNQGTIIKCKNDASVNNASVDPVISLEDLNLDISMDLSKMNSMNLLGVAADTGGIAGYSTGVIETCTNAGTIGYPHIGYNLGGIAGRSCGFVTDCENLGAVYGRKDVGGIVGQMEPYIEVELSASSIARLGQEAKELSAAVEQLEKSIDTGNATLQKRINRIKAYTEEMEKVLEADNEDDAGGVSLSELQVKSAILVKQIELLVQETAGTAGLLGKNVEKLDRQAASLSDTLEGVMEEAENLALSDFADDISEINLEAATLGKVMKSRNKAAIYGDINVGGIAGTISPEYELDPEDDLTAEISMKERRKYEFTAIIYECENMAVITAKKHYAGGICGRMDLGFISDCQGYGAIYSESGDYVGGIAGLTGSTVQRCFTKCSLGGKNYIGGIVGSGIMEDATGESSTVRWCYSMVDVIGAQQFAGAVAGIYAGDYLECYFVSEDLAGMNRINYAGQAEPITYEELLEVDNLPRDFEDVTIPLLRGENATTDVLYITTLKSTDVREDGRSVFLAEGQFATEDTLKITQKEADFAREEQQGFWDKLNKTEILEQWSIEVPEDGLLLHTLRYLPEEPEKENLSLYVKQDGKWKQADGQKAGSYFVVNIAGTDAEIAVVETTRLWTLWLAAVIVIVGMIGGVIWLMRKKKNIVKWLAWVLAVCILVLAIILAVVLLKGKLTGGIGAYQLLKEYVEQPEMFMELSVQTKLGDNQSEMEATVFTTDLEGHQVTGIRQYGVSVFYADGMIFLENGKAYRASEVSADYAELVNYLVFLYQDVDIETLKEEDAKTYRIIVKPESRAKLLSYLLPDAEEDTLEIANLQVDVVEKEETLDSIVLASKGKIEDRDKKSFDITVTLRATDAESVLTEVPESVKEAILSEQPKVEEIMTEDVFRLYAGWKDLYDRNPLGMQIYLNADCGPLSVGEDITFITKEQDDLRVNCIRKNDFSVYFTEDKICNEKGYSVTTKRAESIEPAMLLGLAYELFLHGTFSCTKVDGMYIYSLALEEDAMAEIAAAIAKESTDMAIRFENGSMQVRMQDNKIQSIRFACDGNVDILVTNVAVAFSAELDLTEAETYESFIIPEKVMETLK